MSVSVRMALKVTGVRQRLMSVRDIKSELMENDKIGGKINYVNVKWDKVVRIVMWR
jgi:hypothetical protein